MNNETIVKSIDFKDLVRLIVDNSNLSTNEYNWNVVTSNQSISTLKIYFTLDEITTKHVSVSKIQIEQFLLDNLFKGIDLSGYDVVFNYHNTDGCNERVTLNKTITITATKRLSETTLDNNIFTF